MLTCNEMLEGAFEKRERVVRCCAGVIIQATGPTLADAGTQEAETRTKRKQSEGAVSSRGEVYMVAPRFADFCNCSNLRIAF